LTKRLAQHFLSQDSIVVNTWLNFELHWNRGISFSWFSFSSPGKFFLLSLAIVAVITLFGIYVWAQYKQGKKLYCEMLVLAGALSNLVDRFKFGAVLDFVDFHVGSWHFAVFNIADVFISLGIIGLMLLQVKEWYDARVETNR
jgi:signal peptidase II